MDEFKKNKMLWILLGVTFFNISVFMVGNFLIDKTANQVINKLQKDYSPSPYGPGFDPDKISPEGFKASKAYFEQREELMPSSPVPPPSPSPSPNPSTSNQEQVNSKKYNQIKNLEKISNAWRNEWEQDRGFNPAQ